MCVHKTAAVLQVGLNEEICQHHGELIFSEMYLTARTTSNLT